jgi:uncharacterized protein
VTIVGGAALALLAVVAAALQSATGFGFGVVATPFFVLALGAAAGVQVTIIVTAALSLFMLRRLLAAIQGPLLARLALGSIAGFPVGMLGFRMLDPAIVQAGVGAVILAFTAVLLVAGNRAAVGRASATRPEGDLVSGFVSGVTTALLGISGPPILIYLMLARAEKETIRATLLTFFVFSYVATLLVHVLWGGITGATWRTAGLLVPFAAAGGYLGDAIAGRLSARSFSNIVAAALLLSSAYLIITALGRAVAPG